MLESYEWKIIRYIQTFDCHEGYLFYQKIYL